MYYITNQNNQIIAADPSLLTLLEVKNIDELYREIVLGNTKFSLSTDKVTITTSQNEESYDVTHHALSSMMGNITLVQVQASTAGSILIDDAIAPIEDLLTIETVEDDDTVPIEELLSIETDEEDEISILEETAEENETELFDLLMPTEEEETLAEIETETIETEEVTTIDDSQAPIVIDVENISQSIGISTEDYNTFLNEYIDTALSLEKDLQSTQDEKRSHAIDTLSHLSNVLHLPAVSQIVTQIKNATEADQNVHIESFYAILARLTTTAQSDTQTEKPPVIPEPESITVSTESFGTISLDDVKSIHFDFQLEQAAKDLSLPVELIEEFVHDFIAQAHTETKKMLEAYEKGDLDSIQKIGHLLKGAASNLRIEPLAETLYEIQFCKENSNLEKLIKRYWGHFLSLETQIDLTTK